MTNEKLNPIEHAAKLAGQDISVEIVDGAFIMRPSDAGVMLLAWLESSQKESDQAWDSVDEMTKQLEDVRDENSLMREMLESVSDIFYNIGMDNEAAKIDNLLWKVVGIDDDGNEIEFEWFEETNREY